MTSKIGKELTRVGKQILNLPYDTYHKLTATSRYDRVTSKQTVLHNGAETRGDKIAIYLIFPNSGLLPSHKRAIAYIKDAGYAPFVVSNLPLSDADCTTLAKTCWKVMERPTVGYDFGGYRDAILSMSNDLDLLKRLVILNDSSWFPVNDGPNWLAQAENLGVDFAGAANSYGIQHVAREKYMQIDWKFSDARRNFYYGSFALSIGPAMLRAKKFLPFWKNMKLTKDKYKVVKRGEIALSQFAVKNGFTHAATADLQKLPQTLSQMSFDEIKRLSAELIFWEEPSMKTAQTHAFEQVKGVPEPQARAVLENLILAVIARYGSPYAAPRMMMQHFGFQFLKKTPAKDNQQNSDTLDDVANLITGTLGDTIKAEVTTIRIENGFV